MNYVICEVTIDDKLSCEQNKSILSLKKRGEKSQFHSRIMFSFRFSMSCVQSFFLNFYCWRYYRYPGLGPFARLCPAPTFPHSGSQGMAVCVQGAMHTCPLCKVLMRHKVYLSYHKDTLAAEFSVSLIFCFQKCFPLCWIGSLTFKSHIGGTFIDEILIFF